MSTNLTVAALPSAARAGRTLETLITVTNSGAVPVACSKLKFAIPAGEGDGHLTTGDGAALVTARSATSGWSVTRAADGGATFYAVPDGASAELAPYAKVGVTCSIPLDAHPGTAAITVTAYQPASPAATHDVRITKAAAAAPVISFATDPATAIVACQAVKLTWTTQYATSAVIQSTVSASYSIPSGYVASGSMTVYPAKPVTYTLVAYSGSYKASFPQPIDVTPVTLTDLSSGFCQQGGTAKLYCKVTGASDVTVNGVSVKGQYGEVDGQAVLLVSPTYGAPSPGSTYVVTAYGYVPDGGSPPSLTTYVIVQRVTAGMEGVAKNGKYYITFTGTGSPVNMARLFAYPYNGTYSTPRYAEQMTKNVTGFAPVSFPYVSGGTGATFYLKAYGPYSYAGSVLSLPRNGSSTTAYSSALYFRAVPSLVDAGTSVELKWNVPQAHYASIEPNIGKLTGTKSTNSTKGYAFSGSQQVNPSETTVYTLTVATAWGNLGSYNPQTYIQKVAVIPPAPARGCPSPTPAARPSSTPEE